MTDVDYLQGLFEAQKEHLDFRFDQVDKGLAECKTEGKDREARIRKLEGQKRLNLAASAAGGTFGGFLAVLGKAFWPWGGGPT